MNLKETLVKILFLLDILYGEDQEENSFYLADNVPLDDNIQEDWNLQNVSLELVTFSPVT